MMEKIINYIGDIEALKNLVSGFKWLISSVGVLLAYGTLLHFRSEISEYSKGAIVSINGRLKMRKRLKIDKHIEEMRVLGATKELKRLEDPTFYILYHLVSGVLVGLLIGVAVYTITLSMWYAFISFTLSFPVGWASLNTYFKVKNKKANEEITEDVLTISNILISQVSGGQYMGNALAECSDIVMNKRLKEALEKFDRDLKTNRRTITEAIGHLQHKFNNLDLENLCTVIVQNEETGRSKKVIEDLSAQILSTEKSVEAVRKQRIENMMTLEIIVLFGAIMGYALYLFGQNMMDVLSISSF